MEDKFPQLQFLSFLWFLKLLLRTKGIPSSHLLSFLLSTKAVLIEVIAKRHGCSEQIARAEIIVKLRGSLKHPVKRFGRQL